jgi:hypothetical protein
LRKGKLPSSRPVQLVVMKHSYFLHSVIIMHERPKPAMPTYN